MTDKTGKLFLTLHDGSFVEATLTDEGLILDHYDSEGMDCLATAAATFEEMEPCRYCGGTCSYDEENCCDGYSGDIDNLYAEG